MGNIDIQVQTYISQVRSAGLTKFFYSLTTLFDLSIYFVLVTLCIAYLVYYIRGVKYSMLFSGTLLFGMVVTTVIKYVSNVNRPPDALIYAFGKSFPSWHSTIATIFFVMLIYIFDDYLPHISRITFNVICIIFIFGTALSRVYLGVHWVSDVSFGIILGCLVSFVSIYIFGQKSFSK